MCLNKFRYDGWTEDGSVYECLTCHKYITLGGAWIEMKYCPLCGIKWDGQCMATDDVINASKIIFHMKGNNKIDKFIQYVEQLNISGEQELKDFAIMCGFPIATGVTIHD